MKAIILSGGKGTRLGEATRAISKQLLPVYDKPMIYYPLSYLISCGCTDFLIITTPDDVAQYSRLLSTGKQFGVSVAYCVQPEPKGLAQAYLLAEEWLAGEPSVMALGDNLFYGPGFDEVSRFAENFFAKECATVRSYITGYSVGDPSAYGVVEVNRDTGLAQRIEEKPSIPRSSLAVPGLYWFDGTAPIRVRERVRPSARGELEITSLIETYIEDSGVAVMQISNSNFWFDAGTPDGLLDAANFVASVQRRNKRPIGCPFQAARQRGLLLE